MEQNKGSTSKPTQQQNYQTHTTVERVYSYVLSLILQLMECFNCQSDTTYTVTWEESWSVGDLSTPLTHVGRPSPSRTALFSR